MNYKELELKIKRFIYGKSIDASFDNRIFVLITLISLVIMILGTVINIWVNLSFYLLIISLTATILNSWIYFSVRKSNQITHQKYLFLILACLLLSATWIFNSGVNGINLLLVAIYYMSIIAFFKKKIRFIIYILFLILILSLIATQYYFPETIIKYTDREQRYTDLFWGALLIFTFIYLLFESILGNFEKENENLGKSNKELKQLYFEFAEANEKLRSKDNQIKKMSAIQKGIFVNARYAIVTTDMHGTITSFNPAAEKMLGYKANEVIGKENVSILHINGEIEEKSAELKEKFNIHVKSKFEVFTVLNNLNRENDGTEWKFTAKDGRTFPVLLSTSELLDDNSNLIGYIGIAHDISQRKQAEKLLEQQKKDLIESETKYRTLFERSRDALLIIDEGKFVDCNDATLKILNLTSKNELKNIHPSKISPPFQPDGRPSFEKAEEMMEITKLNGSHRFEWQHRKANGEDFFVEVSLTIIPYQGKEIIHTAWRDISERKKMMKEIISSKDAAEKANQLKSEFLAQMSHEIRSPINAVVSFTSLIRDELEQYANDEIKSSFSSIDTASARVIRTIDSILNMSELQLGTYQINPRKFDLIPLIKNLVNEYKRLAEQKGVELIYKLELNSIQIENDEYALNQVLANLIDNAVKYTNDGTIVVKLRKNEMGLIKIDVEDTGIGISKEYLPHLFEPFSQEEQGYTRKFEGNGLGMALVKKYCDLINAQISVKSEQGKGTIFSIELPKENS